VEVEAGLHAARCAVFALETSSEAEAQSSNDQHGVPAVIGWMYIPARR